MEFNNLDNMYESQRVKKLCEAFDPYLQAVAMNKTDFNDLEAKKLAIMLGNTEEVINNYYRVNESTQVPQVGAEFKKHALALISATFPNLIAEELVSVQPLSYKIGQIFFLKFLYGTNKGGVNKGDVLFDRFGIPQRTQNYTAEFIDEEIVLNAGEQDGNLAFIPVRPGTVVLNVAGAEVKDDGNGNLSDGGTIDYNSGAIHLNAAAGEDVVASYDANFEHAPADHIPEINLEVGEHTVKARPRKLKTQVA